MNGGLNSKMGNINGLYNVLQRLKVTNIFEFNRSSYGGKITLYNSLSAE